MSGEPVTQEFCTERHKQTEAALEHFRQLQEANAAAQTGALVAMAAGIGELTNDFREIRRVLLTGNGTPSIVTTVQRHDTTLRVLAGDIKSLRGLVLRFGWWFFCGVVGSAGVVLMTHYLAG